MSSSESGSHEDEDHPHPEESVVESSTVKAHFAGENDKVEWHKHPALERGFLIALTIYLVLVILIKFILPKTIAKSRSFTKTTKCFNFLQMAVNCMLVFITYESGWIHYYTNGCRDMWSSSIIIESICLVYCISKASDLFGSLILSLESNHDQNSILKMFHDGFTILTVYLINISPLPSSHLLGFIFIEAFYRAIFNASFLFTPFRPNNKSLLLLALEFIQLFMILSLALEMTLRNNCHSPTSLIWWIDAQIILLFVNFVKKFRSTSKAKNEPTKDGKFSRNDSSSSSYRSFNVDNADIKKRHTSTLKTDV